VALRITLFTIAHQVAARKHHLQEGPELQRPRWLGARCERGPVVKITLKKILAWPVATTAERVRTRKSNLKLNSHSPSGVEQYLILVLVP
jgi:hypothetical protein